jgi:four helix bundle protein
MVTHYKQLGIHRLSVEVRQRVFALSKGWPKKETYSLTSQVRRSSRSVGANLAEAWTQERRYERHFVSKLTDALAEVEETVEWLDVALECGYLDEAEHETLTARCRQIASGLVRMMREPEQWCGPAGLIREESEPYDALLSPPSSPPAPPPPSLRP